ncbi:hypothetical protein FA95DRAFT_1560494, partial [Auriscalpium vulgare]
LFAFAPNSGPWAVYLPPPLHSQPIVPQLSGRPPPLTSFTHILPCALYRFSYLTPFHIRAPARQTPVYFPLTQAMPKSKIAHTRIPQSSKASNQSNAFSRTNSPPSSLIQPDYGGILVYLSLCSQDIVRPSHDSDTVAGA